MTVQDLPMINAGLNGLCAIILLFARREIKRGNTLRHRQLMIAAFCVSIIFLASYLTYHALAGVVLFGGQGIVRPFYFVLLTTHTILAVCVPVLATITLVRGLRARYNAHRKIGRWTYPVWLYVSATGVIIYVMLYQIYPHSV
jgi:uncharacterized membrane protein YozB (DUF420 family)